MLEVKQKSELPKLDTYIFVDVSNIRSACLKTLGLKIDFYKLLKYFSKKYPKLRGVYYYEGIAKDDIAKQEEFSKLEKAGYTIRSLERKAYTEPPVYKEVRCRSCKTVRRVQVLRKSTKLKSNVDVYLATDLLKIAYLSEKPVHVILVSCDGDYAEMIKAALSANEKVYISVIATPVVPRSVDGAGKYINRNTCSTRLQELRGRLQNFTMLNIGNIRDLIKQK